MKAGEAGGNDQPVLTRRNSAIRTDGTFTVAFNASGIFTLTV